MPSASEKVVPDAGSAFADEVATNDGPRPWRGPSARGRTLERRIMKFTDAIEADFVPRLVRAGYAEEVPTPANPSRPGEDDVAELTRLVLAADSDPSRAFVAAMAEQGARIDLIYLDLLAPCARLLGDMWVDDRCSFVDVTIGVGRLQQIMRALSPFFQGETLRREQSRHALLVPTPGEQHTFGLVMVAEFLRRAGWALQCNAPDSGVKLAQMVRREWFGFVGFSLSSETRIGTLARCIRAVRKASRNPAIGVLVGGQIFAERPELVARVGADGTASDGQQAVIEAQRLVAIEVR